jgi:hypothetical protein
MSRPPSYGRALRIASIPLILGGLAVHLWLGTKVGLAVAGLGLLAHAVAAALGRRWWRQHGKGAGSPHQDRDYV